ncbi:MAG: alpha/beta hydrolase [Acidobacteriaceae bacterium]|nr:alpha/beta hydrolase [Acidobacteriaceae bacterium]MBV9295785.1 alpha/beta hydrolase [Acidobacteriaceae bacterium]MBV9766144.1 alpha/beta hydrolase [Acidobacteriaceae bacterium]
MLLLFSGAALLAQTATPQTILLWPEDAPGAQGDTDADKPSLTIFPVSGAAKVPTGVIVCPGGGYQNLAMDHEGKQVALWLNNLGISAFVLKYRLGPKYHHPVEMWDGQRAIRYVRAHAADFGIQTDRIGIWGFSAGGHLASTTGTHFDSGDSGASDPIDHQSSRPDFMILAYPVITMGEPNLHLGSRRNLLGEKPDPALVLLMSNELQVTNRTPPTFLFHTTDDNVVPVENSVLFYLACRKAGVPAEMHIYLKGPHGVGLAPSDPVLRTWPDRLADWLKVQGWR